MRRTASVEWCGCEKGMYLYSIAFKCVANQVARRAQLHRLLHLGEIGSGRSPSQEGCPCIQYLLQWNRHVDCEREQGSRSGWCMCGAVAGAGAVKKSFPGVRNDSGGTRQSGSTFLPRVGPWTSTANHRGWCGTGHC